MKVSIREPRSSQLEDALERADGLLPAPALAPSALDDGAPPRGYRFGHTREVVGSGPGDFERARQIMRGWEFLPRWAHAFRPDAPQVPGENLLIVARTLGVWAILPARIIERIDTPTSVGFVYAALPGHVALGIERFRVEFDAATDEVSFTLTALARPAPWLIRIGRPVFTLVQRMFRDGCMHRMREELDRAR